ncbi:MAG: adenylosuccinate synthetase [Candidatus Methylarchaceae archaeon HK01B]|nr:adenylosuccinate synthetase [Candidatus Methylarchaceae archaeon HK01B]
MSVTVLVGGFFGDEGKGKVISYLAMKDDPAVTVRGGVGPNAGHTVVYKGRSYKLRMLPSAILNEQTKLMIGAGVLVNPKVLLDEIKVFDVDQRVIVDSQCSIIEDIHIERDKKGHLKEKIGTTGSGTGPANSDRVLRSAKVARDIPSLKKYVGDVAFEVNRFLEGGSKILLEGTQGTFLSLYYGTYPFVTSKDTTASAICSDVGIGPKKVKDVLVVFKSYVTRVGGGDLPGELSEEDTNKRGWAEVATVTGRVRRAAPFNFDLAKRAVMLNSATQIALTKLDVVFPSSHGISRFEDLPSKAKKFIKDIEDSLGVPVSIISTGPEVFDTIDRRERLGPT